MNTRLQESIQLCSSKVYGRLVAFLECNSKHSLPGCIIWILPRDKKQRLPFELWQREGKDALARVSPSADASGWVPKHFWSLQLQWMAEDLPQVSDWCSHVSLSFLPTWMLSSVLTGECFLLPVQHVALHGETPAEFYNQRCWPLSCWWSYAKALHSCVCPPLQYMPSVIFQGKKCYHSFTFSLHIFLFGAVLNRVHMYFLLCFSCVVRDISSLGSRSTGPDMHNMILLFLLCKLQSSPEILCHPSARGHWVAHL